MALTRTRSGGFHPQVLPRDQRREPVINAALRQMFLLGVSPPARPGAPGSTLVEDAVSAATVSAVSQVLDMAVMVLIGGGGPTTTVTRSWTGRASACGWWGRCNGGLGLCAYGPRRAIGN